MQHKLISAFAALAIFTLPALARNSKATPLQPHTETKVSFLGAEGRNSFFTVQLDAPTPVKFALTLTDEQGNRIYNQEFETSSFSKIFKLVANANDEGPHGLNFQILVPSTGEKHVFEVAASTEAVAEIAVSKW